MSIVAHVLVFFSNLIAAAHFLRFNNVFLFVLFLLLPFLIFIKKKWGNLTVLLSLFLSFAIFFMDTTYSIIAARVQSGGDFKRFLVIMSVVLILQFAGIVLFLIKRILGGQACSLY